MCFRCKASRGNADFDMVYTNVSNTAPWHATLDAELPWKVRPALCDLVGDNLGAVALDLMHIWNLGVLRDLLGSVIKLLVRARVAYSGSTIKKRLLVFNRELRECAKAANLELSCKRIKKETLTWRRDMCPTLKTKAADCSTILQFCAHKLENVELPQYKQVVACAWAGNTFSRRLAHSGLFMAVEERETAIATGELFLNSYVSLATEAVQRGEKYFKVRPKIHYLQHLFEQLRGRSRNPYFSSTFMDEDWIKHAIGLKRKMAHKTSPYNILRRYIINTKTSLDKHLRTRS